MQLCEMLKRENCIQMKNVDTFMDTERYYLGKTDAAKEWNDNAENAKSLFLHTKAYKDFLEEDSLILLGRIGTGKTAILRCLEDEINNGKISNISYMVRIHMDDIITALSDYEPFDNSDATKIAIKRCIEWIINVYVMKAMIKKYDKSSTLINWSRTTKATMRIQHKPGDAMQVDWAGNTIPCYDSVTGIEEKAYLFVAVLPCSCYTYVEACDDMKQENWLLCHIHAYEYL